MGCHIRLPFAPGRNSPKSAEISQTHSCHPATFSHTNPLSEIWTATTFYIWMLQTSNLTVLILPALFISSIHKCQVLNFWVEGLIPIQTLIWPPIAWASCGFYWGWSADLRCLRSTVQLHLVFVVIVASPLRETLVMAVHTAFLAEYFTAINVLLAIIFFFIVHQLIELYEFRNMPPGPRFPFLPLLGHALQFDFAADNFWDATRRQGRTLFDYSLMIIRIVRTARF